MSNSDGNFNFFDMTASKKAKMYNTVKPRLIIYEKELFDLEMTSKNMAYSDGYGDLLFKSKNEKVWLKLLESERILKQLKDYTIRQAKAQRAHDYFHRAHSKLSE